MRLVFFIVILHVGHTFFGSLVIYKNKEIFPISSWSMFDHYKKHESRYSIEIISFNYLNSQKIKDFTLPSTTKIPSDLKYKLLKKVFRMSKAGKEGDIEILFKSLFTNYCNVTFRIKRVNYELSAAKKLDDLEIQSTMKTPIIRINNRNCVE